MLVEGTVRKATASIQRHPKEDFQWLAVTSRYSSSSVAANIVLQNAQRIEFETGLLRRNESVGFRALAHVPINEDSQTDVAEALLDAMSFDHRIANTAKHESTIYHRGRDQQKQKEGKDYGSVFNL